MTHSRLVEKCHQRASPIEWRKPGMPGSIEAGPAAAYANSESANPDGRFFLDGPQVARRYDSPTTKKKAANPIRAEIA